MKKRGILDAWQAFQFTQWSFRVSIVGAQMVAAADRAEVEALLKMARGFGPGQGLHDDALDVQDAARREVALSFATYRRFVVISACAAFENLWKATFVQRAMDDPTVLNNVEVRLSLNPADVIGLSDQEKLFAVADELYSVSPTGKARQRTWTHFERHRYLVTQLLSLTEEQAAVVLDWFEGADAGLFNEMFTLRNCLVHNGGVADRRLAAHGRFSVGESIKLSPELVDDFLGTLEYIGTAYVDKIGLGDYSPD